MIGWGEVDEDLQAEVKEECEKFGPVEKVCFYRHCSVCRVVSCTCN